MSIRGFRLSTKSWPRRCRCSGSEIRRRSLGRLCSCCRRRPPMSTAQISRSTAAGRPGEGGCAMRPLPELRGVRFPDDMLFRMFFKEQLQRTPGRVLEFGCASGNNLMLFAAFGWDVTGIDVNSTSIANARYNLEGAGTLIECDLASELPSLECDAYDVVLMPSMNYYLPRSAFLRVLE